MPRLSSWTLRLALVYLLAGFTLGAFMLADKGVPFSPLPSRLLPIHVSFLLFGFTFQLAIGVAFWILPRYGGGSRGNKTLGWLAVLFLNTGILVLTCQTLLQRPVWLRVVGQSLEAGAGLFFVLVAWGRVKPAAFGR